ncbi:MAG: hypothetical protein QOI49_1037 [Verrucomicrobiota bacterium]
MPGRQPRDIVFANQANEFGLRLACLQRFHRIHSVGGRGAFQFHRVQTKPWLAFNGHAHHFPANLSGRRRSPQFMRGDRGRDKDHALELQLLEGVARQNQMRLVNRVECPAENADLFQSVSYSVVIPSAVEESLAFFRRIIERFFNSAALRSE